MSDRYTPGVPDPKPSLVGMTREELAAAMSGRPDAKLRAKQVAHHLYGRAAESFDQMMDLPAALREELAERFVVHPLHVASHKHSLDGVDKLLVHNGDDQVYECVL
ncbi:MAG TPA: hypothetical protein VGE01_12355, partial [Fimbriimonas sp.]